MTAQRLGDYAKFIRGITFKPEQKCDAKAEGAVACMRTKNVQAQLDQSDLIGVPRDIVKNDEKILRGGDILVSSANSWNLVGKCCYLPELDYPATAGGFISILRPINGKLDSNYLYRWFSSEVIQKKVRSFGNQTTNISNLDHRRALELSIPLPPLAEQKRIARILDAADALRVKRREALAQLDALLQSTFLDMFGDPVSNPKGWDESFRLGDLADIASGITKGRKANGLPLREISYLAVSNVQDRSLRLDIVKTIAATEAEIKKYSLKPGDLLLTEGGDPDKLGRGTLWNGEIAECIHQNHVFRVRLRKPDVQAVFLSWIVASQRGKNYFFRSAKQTTGIASINMKQLKALPLLAPPLDLQRRFATIVESVERQKARMRAHLAELDALFSSLQSRAFNGEL